jgi:hypothetical protein
VVPVPKPPYLSPEIRPVKDEDGVVELLSILESRIVLTFVVVPTDEVTGVGVSLSLVIRPLNAEPEICDEIESLELLELEINSDLLFCQ